MSKFVAQSLVETKTSADRRRFELTFVDADGRKQTVSLPVGVAADLVPVLKKNVSALAVAAATKQLRKEAETRIRFFMATS